MTDPSNEELITEALHRGLDTIPDPLPPLPQWPDKLLLEAMARRLQSSASKAALPDEVSECVRRIERCLSFYTEPLSTSGACLRDAATLLSALASRAQTAEAVAAKSREEAIEDVKMSLSQLPSYWAGINRPMCIGYDDAMTAVHALKHSRTDNGQSPATMPDAPHGDDK